MYQLRKYLINNLSILFLTIFLPLFAIASVIFLIKLATYTAVIKLSIAEMTKLYIFVIPELLFYTLPISFFISATLALFKLSNDNEIVVIFALGIHPKFLIRTFVKPALLLSFLMLFNYLIIFPHSKVLSSNFIDYKKSEAKFNLSASEFGHKFGDWLLYIGKQNLDGTYSDIFLFNKGQEEEILIGAKTAQVINEQGLLRLKLEEGEGYSYSVDAFSQISFKTMYINDTMTTGLTKYRSAFDYWTSTHKAKKKKSKLITNTLLSLFPLLSVFLIASMGIVHARHQKSRVYLYLFLATAIYYGSALGIQKIFGYYTIPLVISVWTIATYILYRKAIVARF